MNNFKRYLTPYYVFLVLIGVFFSWGALEAVLGTCSANINTLGWLAGLVITFVAHAYRCLYKITQQEKRDLIALISGEITLKDWEDKNQ
jgi:hypothetical protein